MKEDTIIKSFDELYKDDDVSSFNFDSFNNKSINDPSDEYKQWIIGVSDSMFNPFTDKEEKECINKINNGDETYKRELINRNYRLVVYIANKYHFSDSKISIMDLIMDGNHALVNAVDKFNYSNPKSKFSTYAYKAIANEIFNSIFNNDFIKIPNNYRYDLIKIKSIKRELELESDEAVSFLDIALASNGLYNEEYVEKILKLNINVYSYEDYLENNYGNDEVDDDTSDNDEMCSTSISEQISQQDLIHQYLSMLNSEEEILAVKASFGIDEFKGNALNLTQIAERYFNGRKDTMRVRNLIVKAKRYLKDNIEENEKKSRED